MSYSKVVIEVLEHRGGCHGHRSRRRAAAGILIGSTRGRWFCDREFFLSHPSALRVDRNVDGEKSPPADAELVAGLIRREPWAFTAAYERHRVRIFSFLVRLCGRRDLAEDLFQDTFLQLARHAAKLRPDTELGAYLFTVARNRYRSHRRTSLFRRLRLQLFTLGGGAERLAARSSPDTPFEHAAQGDLGRQLELALHRLGDAQREALLLVGVEGMDQDRAAQVLGLTPAALRQRLFRARAEVQALLDKEASSAPSKIYSKRTIQLTDASTAAGAGRRHEMGTMPATASRGGSDEDEPARQRLAKKGLSGK